jgi:hypothetical protein
MAEELENKISGVSAGGGEEIISTNQSFLSSKADDIVK